MYIFPAHIFNPANIKAGIVENVISGGVALSGDEDVISTDGGGRWQITYSGIAIRTPALERVWDAWVSHLAGGASVIAVPLVSLRTAPRPVAGNGPARVSRLVANDKLFPTAVSYASPNIQAVTVGAVGIRSTTLAIAITQGAQIKGGERFALGNRGHRIERVLSRPDDLTAIVAISPPTRSAVSAGAVVNFDWPAVQCRAMTGQDLAPDMAYGRNGTISISFVEDFSDAV